MWKFHRSVSFLSRFFFIETSDSQDSRRKEGTIFIPVCHFHQLSNIQTFISGVPCEITMLFSFWKTKLKKKQQFYEKVFFCWESCFYTKKSFIQRKLFYWKKTFFTEEIYVKIIYLVWDIYIFTGNICVTIKYRSFLNA